VIGKDRRGPKTKAAPVLSRVTATSLGSVANDVDLR